MATIEITLFGPPTIMKNGEKVRLHSLKALGLLAYLICHPNIAQSRESLATLFWGEYPDKKARQSLRQALYSLRRVLNQETEPCLLVDAQTLTFNPGSSITVDVLDFAQHLAQKDWPEAISLYVAMFLEGLALDDCPQFEEWLFSKREQYLSQTIQALQQALQHRLANGQNGAAIAYGQRWLALDSLSEKGYQWLMRAYAAQGDMASLERCFQQCQERLKDTFAVEPSEETQRVYEQLKSAASFGPVRTPHLAAPPFGYQGCDKELALLQEIYLDVAKGKGRLVWIRGRSGSGKTELVHQFIRDLSDQHTPLLLMGQAYEAEMDAPYTLWSEALSSLRSQSWRLRLSGLDPVWRRLLARLVPGISLAQAEPLGFSSSENQMRFRQGILHTLLHLSRSAPLLLFLDDVHWSDRSSLELLHYIVRHSGQAKIMIVAAYRSDSPGGEERLRPFTSSQHDVIDVPALRKKDIQGFLKSLHIETHPQTLQRLAEHCQGNRLMLVETLLFLQERKSLDRLTADGELPIPPRIQDLIADRLSRLSSDQRQPLSAAAVIGRPFSLTLLAQVSGQPEMDLLPAQQELVKRGFLQEEHQGRIAFHHDFEREEIYQSLPLSQKKFYHTRTAEALQQLNPNQAKPIIEEIAYHFEQAGDPRALNALTAAAQEAHSFYALSQAANWLTRALIFQEDTLPQEKESRFNILLKREALFAQLGDQTKRAQDIASLIALAEHMSNPLHQATAMLRQAGYLSESGKPAASKAAAFDALSLYNQAQDPEGKAQALRELGFANWKAGDFGMALQFSRQALALHRRQADLRGEASALHNLAEIHRALNSPRKALTLYEEALRLQWADQDRQRESLSFYGMAHAYRQIARPNQALKIYGRALKSASLSGDRLFTSRVHHEMAVLFSEMGDPAQAAEHIDKAVAISRQIGFTSGLAHSLIGLSYLFARQGKLGEAQDALEEAAACFRLLDDDKSTAIVNQRRRQLQENPAVMAEPPADMGWVRSYVNLAEGKVYCEYESPLVKMKNG